ncbi:hypothetical protein [Bifidobacterium avesanii]|uniref:Glycosyltransferase n=1 Tax=Bifidobacterium avesanii TaxID=1798157 RepID=A0A7K3THU6_9BIFI|nr:hypothetical protein [Bifidobacterium avesanii]KAB8291913.1 PMT family glycosyltransferase [Bifidobacterium avesanii]NEG78667.1 hypothetical protein [Bifidobacterium avesanii]
METKLMKHSRRSMTTVLMLVAVLLAGLLEVGVFNAPYWNTRGNVGQAATIDVGADLDPRADGTYDVTAFSGNTYLEVTSDEDIDYLLLSTDNAAQFGNETISFLLSTQQETDSGYYSGSRSIHYAPVSPTSGYVKVGGKSRIVKLLLQPKNVGDNIPITDITVNPQVPFRINSVRVALVIGLLWLAVLLRPKSELFAWRLQDGGQSQWRQWVWMAGLTMAEMLVLTAIWMFAGNGIHGYRGVTTGVGGHTVDWDQYGHLAESLLHGRAYLDIPVSDGLSQLSNPYSPATRYAAIANGDGPIYWDYAYYGGKYYSYFGVIPAVLVFVPYQLLRGRMLPTTYVVWLFAMISVIALNLLLVRVARAWFKGTASIGMTTALSLAFVLGSNMLCQMFSPNFYAVPVMASLAFSLTGLWAWLRAKRVPGRLSSGWVALGSLCIACNLGCRPQFILVALLSIPLFWTELVRDRLLLSVRGWKATLAALLPFLLVFIPILAYNQMRFGNPLAFGSQYNLTGFDATSPVISWTSLLPMVFYYLLQPLNFTGYFPFFSAEVATYRTWVPTEPLPGGILMIAPFMLAAALIMQLKRLEDRTPLALSWLALACALAVLAADGMLGGSSWRYYTDFAWLFMIPTVFVMYRIDADTQRSVRDGAVEGVESEEVSRAQVSRLTFRCFMALLVLSLIVQLLMLFMENRYYSLIDTRPQLYFIFSNMFMAF